MCQNFVWLNITISQTCWFMPKYDIEFGRGWDDFTTLGFLKSKIRNKLDRCLENFLRLNIYSHNFKSSPYERALEFENMMQENSECNNNLGSNIA